MKIRLFILLLALSATHCFSTGTQDPLTLSEKDNNIYLTNNTNEAIDLNNYTRSITGDQPLCTAVCKEQRILAPKEKVPLKKHVRLFKPHKPNEKKEKIDLHVYKNQEQPVISPEQVNDIGIKVDKAIYNSEERKIIFLTTLTASKELELELRNITFSYRMLSSEGNPRTELVRSKQLYEDATELDKCQPGDDTSTKNKISILEKDKKHAFNLSRQEVEGVAQKIGSSSKLFIEIAFFQKDAQGKPGSLLGYLFKEVEVEVKKKVTDGASDQGVQYTLLPLTKRQTATSYVVFQNGTQNYIDLGDYEQSDGGGIFVQSGAGGDGNSWWLKDDFVRAHRIVAAQEIIEIQSANLDLGPEESKLFRFVGRQNLMLFGKQRPGSHPAVSPINIKNIENNKSEKEQTFTVTASVPGLTLDNDRHIFIARVLKEKPEKSGKKCIPSERKEVIEWKSKENKAIEIYFTINKFSKDVKEWHKWIELALFEKDASKPNNCGQLLGYGLKLLDKK